MQKTGNSHKIGKPKILNVSFNTHRSSNACRRSLARAKILIDEPKTPQHSIRVPMPRQPAALWRPGANSWADDRAGARHDLTAVICRR